MTNEDIEEERLGREQHRTDSKQPFEQVRRVEQRVGSFGRQPPLQVGPAVGGSPAQKQDNQLQVCRSQAAPRIRTDHEQSSID
jgi:hypothetical protein